VPIRFRVDESPRSLRFALLPAAEAVMSLHVLLYPKVHSLQHPWVRACRALPAELRRETRAFAFLYDDAFPDCFLPPAGETRPTWEEQLDVVARLEPERAAYELARPLFFYFQAEGGGPERLTDPDVRATALAFARDRAGEDGERLAALAFDDPGRLRDRVVGFLDAYWETAFREEWRRLEPLLDEAAARGAAVAHERGPLAILDGVPGLRVTDGTVIRNSPHEHTLDVSAEHPLLAVPSAYAWPHARVNCDPPWPPALVYAAPFVLAEAARAPVPPELVRTLRAVADETRLRILRLVAERPRSTEELAPLVHLSEPALSRHLRLMAEAGVLAARREGPYVLYELESDALERLPGSLAGFVRAARRSAQPRSGSP
jgi:DNA-binding transcriptional ArsR family regulator